MQINKFIKHTRIKVGPGTSDDHGKRYKDCRENELEDQTLPISSCVMDPVVSRSLVVSNSLIATLLPPLLQYLNIAISPWWIA